jgi:serine/threonine protein kinase
MTGASKPLMPVLVSSTLPCLGTARPGRIFAPKAPERPAYESGTDARELRPIDSVEILELVDAAPPLGTPVTPTVVCGYRIGPLLGRGGLSVLFEVTHPDASEPLAMKVITDGRIQHDLAATAIYDHAQRIATVESPHVVRTLDAGRLPSGEPFVVMERLLGEDLEARLARTGPLAVAEAVDFVMQACDGLAEAHAIGIVHGDIKPANLLVVGHRSRPCLKIIDFAPSVPRASDPDDPLVTCSPGYASPEQLGSRSEVDGRADVWALGAVLYELVTGTRAFTAATLPEMLKVIARVPPSMRGQRPEVPEALDIIVRRCLARDREMRFESPRHLRAALAGLQSIWPSRRPRDLRGVPIRRTARPARSYGRLPRTLFLAALGPASALVSMTLVRLVMASSLVASPAPPPRWPAPEPLTTAASLDTSDASPTSDALQTTLASRR